MTAPHTTDDQLFTVVFSIILRPVEAETYQHTSFAFKATRIELTTRVEALLNGEVDAADEHSVSE